MNRNEKIDPAIGDTCRVPLLALFGGAALWLVVGLAIELAASLTFHNPSMFADHSWLAYGRLQAAANDAVLYGFCIPAALGVILWVFARLSESELVLPLVPVLAANIWHLGVLVGLVAIFIGDTTGFQWLEFPRGASVLLFSAYMLIAISAMATFGARRERKLQPAHWFLLAALVWFPWIYTTANIFLVAWPVRGVAQAVIDWWFTNNLIFVWFALVGLGLAFYFLPKFAGRPLHNPDLALFGFVTFILFSTWCGIPQGAPVPAWLPAASTFASVLMLIPIFSLLTVFARTVTGPSLTGTKPQCKGGPFCYIKFGTTAFILATLMLLPLGCPHFGSWAGITWYVQAQSSLQILGFFTIVICGAIYELMPSVMGMEWPFPKFVRFQHWAFMAGAVLLVLMLAIGGLAQGMNDYNFQSALPFLRFSTLGLFLLLLGSLMFAANIFVMTIKWNLALAKGFIAIVRPPVKLQEVKS
ncbi:MAG TPA: cbb3-type cytochrome c oxidase subunit I [Verrucomicrobiae bacterium]|jgi:cytochrome c oxidase cbb3-type subunit 1